MNNRITRLILLTVVITGITLAVVYREAFDAAVVKPWVNDAGAAGPVLFMLIYTLGTVFFLAGSILTLAGGALFGSILGTVYNLTGAAVGGTLAFLVTRYLPSNWVEQKTGGRLQQLKEGVEGEGWRFVAFVRLDK